MAGKSILQSLMSLLGPLLPNEDVARDFAALILKSLYGEGELAKQLPLQVFDQGETWLVKGSCEESGRVDDSPWFIKVRKADCQVEVTGHRLKLNLPEDAQQIINDAQSRGSNET